MTPFKPILLLFAGCLLASAQVTLQSGGPNAIKLGAGPVSH
jgi:hypothetical protein